VRSVARHSRPPSVLVAVPDLEPGNRPLMPVLDLSENCLNTFSDRESDIDAITEPVIETPVTDEAGIEEFRHQQVPRLLFLRTIAAFEGQ
jgi:hypothetical protein